MGPGTVKEYYNSYGRREWDRLTASAYNQVEYAITMHYLEKYLPREGLVLDAGGGPGRYAIELAGRGYDVVLFDLSPVQLAIAKAEVARLPSEVAERIIAFVEGDITDLGGFPTGNFDALVCLGGTLSHVVDLAARERATSEMARVCRDRASVFVSVFSFHGVLRKVLTEFPGDMRKLPEFMGSRLNPEGTGFTECYFYTAEEAVDLLARKGIEIVEFAGVQGLSAQLKEATERCRLDPASWEIWKDVLVRTCNHPSIVGMSDQLLLVGFA